MVFLFMFLIAVSITICIGGSIAIMYLFDLDNKALRYFGKFFFPVVAGTILITIFFILMAMYLIVQMTAIPI